MIHNVLLRFDHIVQSIANDRHQIIICYMNTFGQFDLGCDLDPACPGMT